MTLTGGHAMLSTRILSLTFAGLLASACGAPQLFPKDVMDGVDANFDFIAWKNAPNANLDRKVQLGGQLVESESTEHETLLIVRQLPIVEHPAYGPKETGKRTGEFVIVFSGTLPSNTLAHGHRLIVVGAVQKARVVTVEDSKRTLPAVLARCLHIWKTGGRDIADFTSVGAGYEPLEEDTYCVPDR
jgi:starvation-inducible outer membrane lipoprotein